MNLHPELTPAYAGTGATWFGTCLAVAAAATPLLQFALLVVSLVVGVLTGVWTFKKIRAENIRATAVVAAAAVKARAVVVAKALDEAKDG